MVYKNSLSRLRQHMSMISTKEPLSQESAPLVEEEVQQKFPVVETGSYYLKCLVGWLFWIYDFVDFFIHDK